MAELQVDLKGVDGVVVGQVAFADVANGVRLVGWARNLGADDHAVALYSGAACQDLLRKAGADRQQVYAGKFTRMQEPQPGKLTEFRHTIPGKTVAALAAGSGSSIVISPGKTDSGKPADPLACAEVDDYRPEDAGRAQE